MIDELNSNRLPRLYHLGFREDMVKPLQYRLHGLGAPGYLVEPDRTNDRLLGRAKNLGQLWLAYTELQGDLFIYNRFI